MFGRDENIVEETQRDCSRGCQRCIRSEYAWRLTLDAHLAHGAHLADDGLTDVRSQDEETEHGCMTVISALDVRGWDQYTLL
jgi:hypothetical protein